MCVHTCIYIYIYIHVHIHTYIFNFIDPYSHALLKPLNTDHLSDFRCYLTMAGAYRLGMGYGGAQITADEFAAVIQLNKVLKMEDCLLLHQFLGHDASDPQWIDGDGRNCTEMCSRSSEWLFGCNGWVQKGWILDDEAMEVLREEFPENFPPPVDRPMKEARCMHTDSTS